MTQTDASAEIQGLRNVGEAGRGHSALTTLGHAGLEAPGLPDEGGDLVELE